MLILAMPKNQTLIYLFNLKGLYSSNCIIGEVINDLLKKIIWKIRDRINELSGVSNNTQYGNEPNKNGNGQHGVENLVVNTKPHPLHTKLKMRLVMSMTTRGLIARCCFFSAS